MEDGRCPMCGTETLNVAGDPGRWPVGLPTAVDPGVMKPHHVECVLKALRERDEAAETLDRVATSFAVAAGCSKENILRLPEKVGIDLKWQLREATGTALENVGDVVALRRALQETTKALQLLLKCPASCPTPDHIQAHSALKLGLSALG